MAAIEILALIMAGLVVVLVAGTLGGWWNPRPARASASTVTLLRLSGFKATHEEMHLMVNDRLIRRITDEGTRAAEYQSQAEDLEKLASSLATALGVEIYLRRVDVREHPEFENQKSKAPA